jgi:hypothetical protein
MTYTFKLSRRLAVSRYAILAAAAMLVSCDGDTTAPESNPSAPLSATPWVRVVPSAVTIETNQPIRFRGERRSPRGEAHDLRLTWHASGGSITDNGVFTASAPGVYKVVGRGRGHQKPDTSVVVVVPPQVNLAALSVAPDTATLTAGGSHGFSATGIRSDGTVVAVGVTWQASGGSIDAGGGYTAGNTAGTYRVIALSTDSTVADTALVSVTAASPPPPPSPTLDRVVVRPTSLSLTSGASAQFTAFGRTSLGDSVPVDVSFSAGGGAITTTGLYTAGPMAGTFRLVAEHEGLADTSVITLSTAEPPPPPPPTDGRRIPVGASQLWSSLGTPGTETYDLAHDGVRAAGIIKRIDDARARNVRLLLNMTGGHDPYMSTINGVYQFDMRKWRDSMATYNTAPVRDAVARAIADGVLIGNSVMDEPHVDGTGTDGNTWGPTGTMTKARVDSMCAYVKSIFPTLPVGVVHQHQLFEPTKSYRVCEFLVDQYAARLGSPEQFRDGALAMARRDGMRILFGANELNGGPQDRDGVWDCKDQGGYKGQTAPNCQVPPDSLRRWYPLLARAGCGFRVWRWDDVRTNTSAYRAARAAVRDSLTGATGPTCARP